MEAFDNVVKKYTTWLDNPYVAGALTVFLVVYAGAAAPKLPNYVVKMFDYTWVKLLMFFLIVFLSRKNATVALIAAIALMVSIMALNRLKFDQEMMAVVNNEENASHRLRLGSCNCTCDDVQEIKPQTNDGKLVIAEAQKAVAVGALPGNKAEELVKKIIVAESQGMSVLIAKTEEGVKRMEEISNLVKAGSVGSEEAKKMEAIVVVAEAVMAAKISHLPINLATLSEEKSVGGNSMAEMAQEVLKRKQEETTRRGGVSPSNEELQHMCASVLDDYRRVNAPSTKPSHSDTVSHISEVSGVDPSVSSYASVNH